MVGEIRDAKTAEVAIKLANTGHLTFSTLHTNDAASVLSRLFKMGIEPFLIAYAINLVIAQRLIRALCTHCKKELSEQEKSIIPSFGIKENEMNGVTFYKPVGCQNCSNGYSGRIGIFETLPFTPDIRRIILTSAGDLDEDKVKDSAIKDGMITLRQTALNHAKKGTTSLAEVASVTNE